MFFDVDEYLILPNYKYSWIFKDEKFYILINVIFYDDNNLIFYKISSTQQRFIIQRHLIKKSIISIIRTVFWTIDINNFHFPKGKYKYWVCDVTGKKIKNKIFLTRNI